MSLPAPTDASTVPAGEFQLILQLIQRLLMMNVPFCIQYQAMQIAFRPSNIHFVRRCAVRPHFRTNETSLHPDRGQRLSAQHHSASASLCLAVR